MTAQLPAFLANRNKPQLAKAVVESFGVTLPPHMSIKGNRFTLIDGAGNSRPVETFHLDVAIVDMLEHFSRMYYPDDYDPDDRLPPMCFSDNGVGASSRAREPQSASCATCPHSRWDKINALGNKVPACSQGIKIALLAIGDASHICYFLRIPPGSMGNFKAYGKMMKDYGQIDMSDVVTRIKFKDGAIGELLFEPVGYVDEPTAKLEDALWAAKATDSLIGRDDVPFTGQVAQVLPKPQAPTTLAEHPANMGSLVGRQLQGDPRALTQNMGATNQEQAPVRAPFLPGAVAQQAAEAAAAKNPVGRPRKKPDAKSPAQQQAEAAQTDDMPAFLQRPPAGNASPDPSFGIQENAPPPNADLQASLKKVFDLST